MGKIRVVVASHPRLMRDLVLATISDQPDIELARDVTDDCNIVGMADECNPDFIIIFAQSLDNPPAVCSDLLIRNPQVKILALVPEQNQAAAFYWTATEIRSTQVEYSEQGLLDALRGKTRPVQSAAIVN